MFFDLGDEDANFIRPFGRWKDVAVRLYGEAVKTFVALFLQNWHLKGNKKEDIWKDYLAEDINETEENGNKTKKGFTVSYAGKRGADVKIMIPHIPDKKTAFLIARSFYLELMNAGVKIYEYTHDFVHAKVFVSDDCIETVGSYNMDSRSFYLNYEISVWFANCPAVKDIADDYKKTLLECQEMKLLDYEALSLSSRIAGRALRIFGPLKALISLLRKRAFYSSMVISPESVSHTTHW